MRDDGKASRGISSKHGRDSQLLQACMSIALSGQKTLQNAIFCNNPFNNNQYTILKCIVLINNLHNITGLLLVRFLK